jgi:hypothetical protein
LTTWIIEAQIIFLRYIKITKLSELRVGGPMILMSNLMERDTDSECFIKNKLK